MQTPHKRDAIVAALKHAAPYIRMYKRKTFVLKAGGEVFDSPASTRALIEQIAILNQVGIRVVLVHGGGPQATRLGKELGVEPTFVQGRRVTDAGTLEVTARALARINEQILAACEEIELPAVGVSGSKSGLIHAHRRPPVDVAGQSAPVDYGFVGDIDAIEPSVLMADLDKGLMPVVSPLSADASGNLLNINADTVAAALAAALNAEKLILATGAAGILERLEDPASLVSYIDLDGLNELREAGSLADGMLPKAAAIEAAIHGGVPRVHVISYKMPDSLLLEVFTNEGTGTLVVGNIATLSPAEQTG